MLDIKRIKENPEAIKARLATRQKNYDAEIDRLLALDVERRALIADTEAKKAEQNRISKTIPQMKKEGRDVAPIFAEMKLLSDTVKADDARVAAIDAEIEAILLSIPNTPNETVPVGKDDTDNKEIRRWGTPRDFAFEPKAHWDLGRELGILDPDTAAKVTGTRFHFYRGLGSRLERAVINYFLDTHTQFGYTEIFPPYMVNRDSMRGTGQLPKFEEDAFRVANNDCFLIPTAEVPVTNMHRDEILNGADLPISYCAYSACFRAEAGSAGRDTRGLIRQHQFNKVEL
ncbi:MAG: serine--tRNA ligase, partial [Clostridia bacterium]|nr:serine--tRNA ligase [Clostridia bacterium]